MAFKCRTLKVKHKNWGSFAKPMLPRKSNKYYIFWVCVCSFGYPACNAHAPYCHLWPTRLYNIFPHYLIKETNSGKKLLNTKSVFLMSSISLSETFLILRGIQWDIIINKQKYSRHVPIIIVRFLRNLNFTDKFSKNIQILSFIKIRAVAAQLFYADRWTDRRTQGRQTLRIWYFVFS
jgi:hypothetical protein